jgi:hypothetical protein
MSITAEAAIVGAFSAGPKLTGIKPTLAKLREFLGGRLAVQDGVAIQSHDNAVNLQVRLVGGVIQITCLDPRPTVDLHYIIQLVRDIAGIRVYEDRVEIDIPNLPNPTFDIVS